VSVSAVAASLALTATRHSTRKQDALTTDGAGGRVDFTLPGAVLGLRLATIIYTTGAAGVRVYPFGDDTIRHGASVTTASTGYLSSSAEGDTITLQAIGSGRWVVVAYTGTWTVV
jgi:hypothetical protein